MHSEYSYNKQISTATTINNLDGNTCIKNTQIMQTQYAFYAHANIIKP